MAFGETFTYDNAAIFTAQLATGGTAIPAEDGAAWTDISGYVAQAMVAVNHVVTPTPHTFGLKGAIHAVSDHYDVAVTMDLVTDNFGTAGLDAIFRAYLPGPIGTGSGYAALFIKPAGAQNSPIATPSAISGAPNTTHPAFKGRIVVANWEPFGPGQVGALVRQTRNFVGNGDFSYDVS